LLDFHLLFTDCTGSDEMRRPNLRWICNAAVRVGAQVLLVLLFTGHAAAAGAFSDFNFTLSQGTYWEFYWTYQKTSYAQGSGGSTAVDAGNFRVTLGAPKSIQGVTAYAVSVSGDSTDPSHDYAPRWAYLAVDNHRILGSVDGVNLKVIRDANTGQWQGGGFFTTFSDQSFIVAANGQIDNEFVQTSAVTAGRSASQSFCETIGGYYICPNDEAYTLDETEYYKGGIGPLGYYFYLGYSSSGGGFYTSFTYTRHLGLVASSLKATDGFTPELPPWTKKSNLLTPREYHSTAVLDGKIYAIGGTSLAEGVFSDLNSVEIYTPQTDTWTMGTAMPEARSHHGSVAVNGKIYVVGGLVGKPSGSPLEYPSTLVYDPQDNNWTRKARMPQKEVAVASVAMAGYIWVFPDDSTSVHAYSVSEDRWYFGTSRPVAYHGSTASGLDGKIYLIGGLSAAEFRRTCLQYDIYKPYGSPEAWTYKMSMPTGRTRLTSEALAGKIYAVGGFNYDGEQRTVEEYDPATDTWQSIKSMLTPREMLASAVAGGKLYVSGGRLDN
jgi:hypothetical protein